MSLLRIRDLASPNHDARPEGGLVDMIVLHYTGMRSAAEAVHRLRDPAAKVSAHYVVDEDGAVLRLVPEDRRAWHAGAACWRGATDINARSVGIEIVNPGHEHGYRAFTALQTAAVCDLCLEVLSRHPVPARNIIGHSDIAPERKQDPGELFDWRGLAENGVGIWPFDVPGEDITGAVRDAGALRPVRAMLAQIGYRVAAQGALDPALAAVLRAFQRHWRPEMVNGQADRGTRARLAGVSARVG